MPIVLSAFLIYCSAIKPLQVSSPAFEDKGLIPVKYTCQGQNINPEIRINAIPEETQSLVLIMDDPDAPKGTFDHWVMWNITPNEVIKENSSPGKQGLNGRKEKGYTGPCPPEGEHRYFIKIYALDAMLVINGDPGKKELEESIEGHVLARGELMGRYKKQ